MSAILIAPALFDLDKFNLSRPPAAPRGFVIAATVAVIIDSGI